MHEKFHNFDSACELWSSLTTKQAVDPMFPGPVYFASKLCGFDQQLAWACVESILAVDEEVGASVFIKHRNSDDQKFIEKSLSLMCKYKEARRIYLEDLVFNKQSQGRLLNNNNRKNPQFSLNVIFILPTLFFCLFNV